MIVTHNELMEQAKEILRKKGFKEDEIHTEYEMKIGDNRFQRIDVVGISKTQKIAIECGGLHKNIAPLKNLFDSVIILPYVKNVFGKFMCSNCEYEWSSRVEFPKQCPRCKRYLVYDKNNKPQTYSRKEEKKHGN